MSRPAGATVGPKAYFVIAFGYSWLFWIAATLAAPPYSQWLIYCGIPGPLVAALVLLHCRGTSAERHDFYRRILDVQRLRPGWLLVVLLLYPALTALAAGLGWLAGGDPPDISRLAARLHQPQQLLVYTGLMLLLGPLPEEPGWRGYALDRLTQRCSPFAASLWLGLLWGAWHLPLFFVSGTYQHALGVGTVAFWQFMLTAVAVSILITWIYRHNGRSVLAAILFHLVLNLSRDGIRLDDEAELLRTVLLVVVTALVLLFWRDDLLRVAAGKPG